MAADQTTTLALTLHHMLAGRPITITSHRKEAALHIVSTVLTISRSLGPGLELVSHCCSPNCCVLTLTDTSLVSPLPLYCTLGNGQRNGLLLLPAAPLSPPLLQPRPGLTRSLARHDLSSSSAATAEMVSGMNCV